eukprot:CAMPEP_0168327910 /NCGR_PEP_ID=MMETSP0213-20121227/6162_1 /TAXON_ID=151035 /ORGANISM="Euplotes harpa, Strain FSP1.4" /LENGTH=253 /DNA_ID=CAMNT_0008330871 /DNA_START=250 /DNA_END=1009 /DNA_ORIENTATION=+
MMDKADKGDLEAFWGMYPDLKQHVDLFLIDYYKIFPESKPVEEGEPAKKEEVDFEPQVKKKNFFAALNEDDDVIMAINKLKTQKKKVEVNIRKDAPEVKEDPKAKLQAEKDKLKNFKLPDEKKDKEINYDAIFQYAMDVVKASDQVGPDPKFSGGMSKKKLACEAPPRIMESSNDAPFLGLNKAKSEKPQLSSKRIDEEKTAEKPLKPPEPKVIEEEKAEIKNEIASPSMNKKSPDEEKPRRGLMMMGKGLKG